MLKKREFAGNFIRWHFAKTWIRPSENHVEEWSSILVVALACFLSIPLAIWFPRNVFKVACWCWIFSTTAQVWTSGLSTQRRAHISLLFCPQWNLPPLYHVPFHHYRVGFLVWGFGFFSLFWLIRPRRTQFKKNNKKNRVTPLKKIPKTCFRKPPSQLLHLIRSVCGQHWTCNWTKCTLKMSL